MPHCIIEYAQPLEHEISIEQLMLTVQQAAIDSALFEADAIKVRATGFQHYITGQANGYFVHIDLRILSGRTAQQKRLLSETVLSAVKPLLSVVTSTTVAVSDLDRASYQKVQR
ncbi:5-carboxymethyl-2-hydroxymuconate Delta-isomerase [Flocculibacter collagenilyticus]|uniref:5-carboxymethyl-2-hydroxymuconate Delta-isomerase n=1 Tax=Flocculibacter collagenilyticus TaxID=2744479 RepID=UPI0018F7C8F1|nr:5-carboxymethyl-2-hydroxymuconate Delta-isomerase [Flocculibacter collagenilyticus]